jgi:hypothetical protein
MKDGMLLVEHTPQLSILNKEQSRRHPRMNRLETIQLEPFVEVTGDTYRFGYRTVGIGNCVSAIDVPMLVVEQAVLTRASSSVRVGPDGTVISHMLTSHVMGSPDLPTDVASIEVLVKRAVNAENLRMEEATAADLSTLLQRLEDSVRLVKVAISQMASETKAALRSR